MGHGARAAAKKGRTEKSAKTEKSWISDLKEQRLSGMDYSKYHMTSKEMIEGVLLYIALDLAICNLFYESWLPFPLLFPGIVLLIKELKTRKGNKQKKEMKRDFLDAIHMLSGSLKAGYSIENALCETVPELRKVQKPDGIVLREFEMMEIQMSLGKNLEELFLDFGNRSGDDDIQSFAAVFSTAKRSGGDLLAIIRNTSTCIRQKQETMQEIETCLSGKVMEQNVMSAIPMLIIAYVKLTSPEFIMPVYENIFGRIVMTGCLAAYVFAYFWGQSIVRIEV